MDELGVIHRNMPLASIQNGSASKVQEILPYTLTEDSSTVIAPTE